MLVEHGGHQVTQRLPEQHRMVQAQPPQSVQVDAGVKQVAHGLVCDGGLADPSSAKDNRVAPRLGT